MCWLLSTDMKTGSLSDSKRCPQIMSKPLHDAMITNLPISSIQWVKIYLLQILLYNDGSAQDRSNSISNALELLQSCTKPSIYFTCKVLPLYHLSFFLVLLPPHHIQNIYQTYNSNSVVFEKMVEIMQMGFGKCKYFKFKQNIFENISEGFTNEVGIGSDNGFEPTSHWLIGNWEIMMLL